MENNATNEDDGTSQVVQTEPVNLNLKLENLEIQCEKIGGHAKEGESNAAVEFEHIGEASGSCKLQRDRKIRRAMTGTPKYNGVKWIKTRQKKLIVKKSTSFGSFIDTQLCKITNQKYRDKTEREILRFLYDRIEKEPVKLKN